MVGVPGRSKGCITCKKRKVKCDEAKPTCQRCRKAYMICEGYKNLPGGIFVHEARKFERAIRRNQDEISASSVITASTSDESTPIGASYAEECQEVTPKIGVGPSLRGSLLDICVSYTTTRLFPGAGCGPVSPNGARSWLFDAIQDDDTSTVYYSICSLSAAFFGRIQRDEVSSRTGALYYGKALIQLNRNLNDSSRCWAAANVVAASLLVVYELSVHNNAFGWLQHAGGIERLIQLRGPESYRQEPARNYFLMSRLPMVGRAIKLRRKTFLEGNDWLEAPWLDTVLPREPPQSVIDIMTFIPSLLEDSDSLEAENTRSFSHQTIAAIETLRIRVINVVRRLVSWRWEWESQHPNSVFEVKVNAKTSSTVDDYGEPVYESILYYREFHHGNRAIILYDSSLLLMLELVAIWKMNDVLYQAITLAQLERKPPISTNPLMLPHQNLSTNEVAQEICRSVEYNLQGPKFAAGAMMMLLPLNIVAGHVSTKRERQWLVRTLNTIGDLYGFQHSYTLASSVSSWN